MSDSFAIPWTGAGQAPPSVGFSRQEYWSGLPFPSPGYLPDPGIEPESPALAHGFFTTEPPEKLIFHSGCFNKIPDDLAISSPRTAEASSSILHCLHMHCLPLYPWCLFFFFFGIFVLRDLGASQALLGGKESACHCRRHKRFRFYPWVRKIPSRRKWQPTSVFLPAESHRQRSLASYSPWGCKELDLTQVT